MSDTTKIDQLCTENKKSSKIISNEMFVDLEHNNLINTNFQAKD